MKLKSLLLGSAAGLFAVTGAQAADLPVAEPVEYVRVCDAFGAGFFYIPGTDTCLKVGGRVRAEAHYTHGFDDDNSRDRERGDRGGFVGRDEASPEETRSYNNFTTRARGYLNLDARTQSDYGVVRAYVQIYSTIGPATGPVGNSAIEDYSSSGTTLDEAFVSLTNDWGTFKAGRTFTNFDFFRGYAFDTIIGSDDPSDSVNQFAFTGTLGTGFSATIAIEDPRTIGRTVSLGEDAARSLVAIDPDDSGVDDVFVELGGDGPDGIHGGQRFPDAVGNLRFDGGWGSAQIMGALHHVREAEYALDASANPRDDGTSEVGYAVGAGGTLKVPNTNIEASLQGIYGEGAIGYVTTGNGAPRTDGIVQRVLVREQVTRADGSIGTRVVRRFSDDIDLTEAYAINAGLSVGLTDTITAAVTGSYADVEFGDEGQGGRAPRPGTRLGRIGGAFTPRLVDDYDTWTLAGTLSVTPISGLVMGVEVEYENVDFDENNGRGRGGDDGFDFRGNDESEDDRWGGMVRIQRTF